MAIHERFITKFDTKAVKSLIKAAEKGSEGEFRVYSAPARNVAEKVLRICFADYEDDNFFEVIERNLSSVKHKKYKDQFHYIRKNLNKTTHEHNIESDFNHERMIEIVVTLREAITGILAEELGQDMKLPEVKIPSESEYSKTTKLHQKIEKKQQKEIRKAIKVNIDVVKESKIEAKIKKLEQKSQESASYKASMIELFNISAEKNKKKLDLDDSNENCDNLKINFVRLKRDLVSYIQKYHSDVNEGQYDFGRLSVATRKPYSILKDLETEVQGKYRDFLYIDLQNEKLKYDKFDIVEIPSKTDSLSSLYFIARFRVNDSSERYISEIFDIAIKRETRVKRVFDVIESLKVAVAFKE